MMETKYLYLFSCILVKKQQQQNKNKMLSKWLNNREVDATVKCCLYGNSGNHHPLQGASCKLFNATFQVCRACMMRDRAVNKNKRAVLVDQWSRAHKM